LDRPADIAKMKLHDSIIVGVSLQVSTRQRDKTFKSLKNKIFFSFIEGIQKIITKRIG